MMDPRCAQVQEDLPDFVAGRLAAAPSECVQAHLDTCDDCRAESELVALLFDARPAMPAGLTERIQARVRTRRAMLIRPWWGLAAAGLAAVALGIGVSSRSEPAGDTVPAYVADLDGSLSPWVSDDGLIAGAPALDGLSDEALMTLLEEMGSGSSGGAA